MNTKSGRRPSNEDVARERGVVRVARKNLDTLLPSRSC